jgi:preprotein translocase subunit YajC
MFGFFISNAYAMAANPQAGQAAQEVPWYANPFTMMILIFVIFYFFLIYPQRKEQKKHQERLNNLKTGDKVITSGGIHGIVANASDDPIKVKIADNVKIEVSRSAIVSIKSDENSSPDTK